MWPKRECVVRTRSAAGASNGEILAKYLRYHFLLSWIVSELFKGIFVSANYNTD